MYESRTKKYSGGLVGLIIVLIIGLIILGYMGFSARSIVESPQVQENLKYGWSIVKALFGEIGDLIVYLWNMLGDFLKELAGGVSNWK